MRNRHRILPAVTNTYWFINLVALTALTLLSYNYNLSAIGSKESNSIIYYFNILANIQICGDRLTWFGIITALWISGLTIIVFILGKTEDVIYGIKFSNIFIWQISMSGVLGSGCIYVALFPWGLWACFFGTSICIIVDICLIYTWIIGASFFVIFYSKRTNIFKAIQHNTHERVKKICRKKIDFDIDYYGLVNQLPLMKMIRCLESNDSEVTQRVKECLLDICEIFKEESIPYQYFILMPIISAYCEKSGFKTRYEAAGTVDFFLDLLRHSWNKNCCLWIRVGIILPILEKWRGSNTGIDIVYILRYFPQSDRRRIVVVMLLYIEYLRCCGDVGEEYITALRRMDLPQIVHEYVLKEDEKRDLKKFWISWSLLNHQENFQFDIFHDFVNDYKNFANKNYACQTWVMKRLMWEELKNDQDSNFTVI